MKAPRHLHSLDILRGVAALAVVLTHWRFWSYDHHNALPGGFDERSMPFGDALYFLYHVGHRAVELFFCLSGFVFFWLFRQALHERRLTGRGFVVDRFSRLYPLHLATLLAVALMQWGYSRTGGWGFAFNFNTLPDFFRHLLVFPLWTPRRSFAFNGPDWTLAVEAFLYLLFFVAARLVRLTPWTTFAIALGVHALAVYSEDLTQGAIAFWMGGMACLAFERIEDPRVEAVLSRVVVVSWLLIWVDVSQVISLDSLLPGTVYLSLMAWPTYVAFPATILWLALRETRRGPPPRALWWLGDLSYSSYLLHFPLMLALAWALRDSGIGWAPMNTRAGLVGFLVLLVGVSLLSHHRFERPVQEWLRRRFGPPRPPKDDGPAPEGPAR